MAMVRRVSGFVRVELVGTLDPFGHTDIGVFRCNVYKWDSVSYQPLNNAIHNGAVELAFIKPGAVLPYRGTLPRGLIPVIDERPMSVVE